MHFEGLLDGLLVPVYSELLEKRQTGYCRSVDDALLLLL